MYFNVPNDLIWGCLKVGDDKFNHAKVLVRVMGKVVNECENVTKIMDEIHYHTMFY